MVSLRALPQDVRGLARAPGLAALVVLMLAAGIGATTAMFSVVHGVLLRPLPFPEAERLVRLCETGESVQGFCVASPPNVRDWARRSRTLTDLGLARDWPFILRGESGAGGGEEVAGGLATPGFFRAFGIEPLLGRLLLPADLEAGAAPVVVLSHELWQTRFAGAPGAVGRQLTVDGEPHEVVGVLPPEAEVPDLEHARIWLPLRFFEEEHRPWRGFQAVARLRDGASLAEARSELAVLAAALARQYPEANRGWGIAVLPLQEWLVGPVRPTLLLFLGAVGFVLLIACANAGNLLLGRALARQTELAVRSAIGAPRGRLVRLLLGESLLLALLGGALGVALAHGILRGFLAVAPRGIPRLDEVGLGGAALGFALLLSLGTSLLCGLLPALRASRADAGQALKGAAPGQAGRPALSAGLVAAEVALALILVVGAGLLTRSFVAAGRWQGGFDPGRLLAVSVLCPTESYRVETLRAFYPRAVRELAALPGVAAAGAASAGPFFGGRETLDFLLADRPEGAPLAARFFDVDPGYFATVGLPLLRGRPFTERDGAAAPPVVIVNATLARRFWPGEDPVGKRLRASQGDEVWREVVGVVADAPLVWPQREVEPEVYWPNQQETRWASFFLIRTELDGAGLAAAVGRRLQELDPGLSVGEVTTAQGLLSWRLVRPRFNMLLVGAFTLVALGLALGGAYSVVAYATARRTREIGLRMALGASRRQILGWALGQGLRPAALGIALGLAGALALARAFADLFYGVGATDGPTFTAAIALLFLVALAAVYLPARRAARVEPMTAIRQE